MRYAVIGGDMRFAHLARMLEEAGRYAMAFFHEKSGAEPVPLEALSDFDVAVSCWPMRWPCTDREIGADEILDRLAPGSTLLLCGPQFPQERKWQLQYVNLWEDERLLLENAWLTAEAAAGIAAGHIGGALCGISCGVVGYGRIGRALTNILIRLGADVRVFTGSAAKMEQIIKAGAAAMDVREIAAGIRDRRFIFSTVPACVLDADVLGCVSKDAFIMDLASPPYGVNLDAAMALGIRAWREPGLPGRYCPLSAGRAIFNAVMRWEEEENG